MKFFAIKMLAAALLLCASSSAFATTIHETIYTSPYAGSNGFLYFEYVYANGGADSVTLSNFQTDGTLGAVYGAPDTINQAAGTLPTSVVFNRSSTTSLTDYLQGLTLGNQMSFDVDFSAAKPGASTFSLFLTSDQAGMMPMLTGDGMILSADLNSNNTVDVYNAAPVPEPSTILLLCAGLAGVAVLGKRRQGSRGANTALAA